MARIYLAAGFTLALLALSACQTNDLKEPPVPLGDFGLGVNVAITDKVQVPSVSRKVEPDVLNKAVTDAVAARFDRYSGTKLINIGVYVDGYLLAPPGIPIVLSPSSVMIVTLNFFDDATGVKLNPAGDQITVIEKGSADTFIGSGLTQTKEKQLQTLAYNVAKRIEGILLQNPSWIGMTEAEAAAALAQLDQGAVADPAAAALAAPSITPPPAAQ
jgi:hypothetical protein